MEIKRAYYKSKIGIIEIGYEEDKIIRIGLLDSIGKDNNPTDFTSWVFLEIEEYLRGNRQIFSFAENLSPQGTSFQKEVWDKLKDIPYGQTVTYKDIAISLNKPKASRAVANAIGKNPIFIIIPCHRVIGSDGSLRGFAYGIDIKRQLLAIEMGN